MMLLTNPKSFAAYQRLKTRGLDIDSLVPVCSIQYCEENPLGSGMCRACTKRKQEDAAYTSLSEDDLKRKIRNKKDNYLKGLYKENLEELRQNEKNKHHDQKIGRGKKPYVLQTRISKHLQSHCSINGKSMFVVNQDILAHTKKRRDKMNITELESLFEYVKTHYPANREMSAVQKDPGQKYVSVEIDEKIKTIRCIDYNKESVFLDITGIPIGIYITPLGEISVMTMGRKIIIPPNGKSASVFRYEVQN